MTDFIDHIEQSATVSTADCGRRLDQIAAELFSDYSRSRLQLWIKSGELTVDGQQQPPKFKLLGGEKIAVSAQLKAGGLAGRRYPVEYRFRRRQYYRY